MSSCGGFERPSAPANAAGAKRLRELMISDSGFAFDPQTGLTYSVNPVGASVIRWINDGLNNEQIVQCMIEEYDVDEYTATRDVGDFLSSLRHHTLI
ncbi:MAG TPA: HPr-rel-A system PqqD family protein [Planctomycetaceae bacterium]|nr:HPr-rel-A system PqqD family protein [Planctomycetaceae bacterium]